MMLVPLLPLPSLATSSVKAAEHFTDAQGQPISCTVSSEASASHPFQSLLQVSAPRHAKVSQVVEFSEAEGGSITQQRQLHNSPTSDPPAVQKTHVPKPLHTKLSKVSVSDTDEGSTSQQRTLQNPPKAAAPKHGSPKFWSFIQTSDVVQDAEDVGVGPQVETWVPSANGSETRSVTRAIKVVHDSWRHGLGGFSTQPAPEPRFLTGAATCVLAAWLLCLCVCSRKKHHVGQVELSEWPLVPQGLKHPDWSEINVSFVVPLKVCLQATRAKFCRLKLARRPKGPPLYLVLVAVREPEERTWARLQLFSRAEGDMFTSPLASCCLVPTASEAESDNMQSSLMTWLSLIMENEKTEDAAVDASPPDIPPDTNEEHLIWTPLHEVAEQIVGTGSNNMQLKVRDSSGAPAGLLTPAPRSSDRYIIARQGEVALEIKMRQGGAMILSKNNVVRAVATHRKEQPGYGGQEGDENLQIDIRESDDGLDYSLLLISVLAMIIFKPICSSSCLAAAEAPRQQGPFGKTIDALQNLQDRLEMSTMSV